MNQERGKMMEQLGQAIQLTIIGMAVVFIVLTLLTFLLKLMGKFFAPEEEEKQVVEKEKKVTKGTKKSKEKESKYVSKAPSESQKRAAAVSAALAMYENGKYVSETSSSKRAAAITAASTMYQEEKAEKA